jgi:hypothetical protein
MSPVIPHSRLFAADFGPIFFLSHFRLRFFLQFAINVAPMPDVLDNDLLCRLFDFVDDPLIP